MENEQSLPDTQRLCHSVQDVLAMVPIGITKLYAEIKAGRLQAFHMGKRRLIDDADLKAWYATYKRGTPGRPPKARPASAEQQTGA